MPTPAVVYDACVLYPAALRDLLMHLALQDLFRAKWSERIHAEWIEAVLRTDATASRERLERTRRLMDLHVENALVTEYEHRIEGLNLPDPNDRHVLAAAVEAGASLIVTFNLKHFPDCDLIPHGTRAVSPDTFVAGLQERVPEAVFQALRNHRRSLKNPPKTAEEYTDSVAQQGLPRTAQLLRVHRDRF